MTSGVTVKVKNLDKLGEVLDAAVEAGADSVDVLSFDVADRTKHADLARARAVEDAERKARQIAEKAGGFLGQVLYVGEDPLFEPPRPFQALGLRAMGGPAAEEAAPFPVSPGETDIRVRVRIHYAIR